MRKDSTKAPVDAANAAHQQGILLAFFTAFGIGIVIGVVFGLNIPLLFGVGAGLIVLVVTYDGRPYRTHWPGARIGYVVRSSDERGTPPLIWKTHKELLVQTYRSKMYWFAASGLFTAIVVSVGPLVRHMFFVA